MKHTITLNHTRHTLDAAQLIQSGGEGMVFDLGSTAVKLYHRPTAQHAAKLRHLLNGKLAGQLPPGVLGPCAPATNAAGDIIGFQMPKLPPGSLPLKKLSSPLFCQKNGVTLATAVALLRQIHTTLSHLHQLGLVVGDLNDHNLHFTPTPTPAVSWIDVDSYQIDRFPCPVALPTFLDPDLYHVADFGKRPYFSPQTDWYAFAVLLVKTLLHTHPYGGSHPLHKSLQARAENHITIFDSSVTYPVNARPPQTLSDDLLHALQRTFGNGRRDPLPLTLLDAYAHSLTTCPHCAQSYPKTRSACPHCHTQQTISPPPRRSSAPLLTVDGVILHVTLRSGNRFHIITRSGSAYKLVRLGLGGIVDETVLFTGQPGYRFAAAGDLLVVNPPARADLLVLDVSGQQPKPLAQVETGLFRETAVFTATPHALYRLAGTWIMRGTLQNGLFVEEQIATAHRRQTIFWGSPYSDTLAGRHRIFAENRFFLWHEGSSFDVALPAQTIRETAVGFAPHSVQFALQTSHDAAQWHTVNLRGQVQASGVEMGTAVALANRYPIAPHQYPHSTTDTRLFQTHTGILAQHPTKLTLAP